MTPNLSLLKIYRKDNEPPVSRWLGPTCPHCETELRADDESREGFHLYCYLQTQAWNATQELKKFERRKGKKSQEQMLYRRCYQNTRKLREKNQPKIVSGHFDGGAAA